MLAKALTSLDPGDEEMELLKKHFQEFIAGLMSLPLTFPGTQLYRSLQAKKKMVKLIDGIIQAKRTTNPTVVTRDVADVLLNDTSGELTDDLIADNLIDLMIPGEDSVPVLITLAIKYLSDCPAALNQLTVRYNLDCYFTGVKCDWINDFFSYFVNQMFFFLVGGESQVKDAEREAWATNILE